MYRKLPPHLRYHFKFGQTIWKPLYELQHIWSQLPVCQKYPGRSVVVDYHLPELYVAVSNSVLPMMLERDNQRNLKLINENVRHVIVTSIRCFVHANVFELLAKYEEPARAEEPITSLSDMPYNQYLQTPEWRARTKEKKKSVENRCQLCNSPNNLHTHHRTYDRRGEERDDDLIVLCAECHELFHTHSELYVEREQS